MKQRSILIYGYGIDKNRTEAVSLNTLKLIKYLEKNKWQVHVINIGYPNKAFFTGNSPTQALFRSKDVISKVKNYIQKNNISTVIDVFVLPLSTVVFTRPLVAQLPHVKFIKEVHNDAGFSRSLHPETFIRILANNRFLFKYANHPNFNRYTRNRYLATKYNLEYLPNSIKISNIPRKKLSANLINIGYLGHPLKKKGIFEFPKLFALLDEELKQRIIFNFALSDIGDRDQVRVLLQTAAQQNGVKITLSGTVVPSTFFRAQDFYLLPLHDQFGAVSSPNTILEAMEAGAIPIVPEITSLNGIVINGKTGMVTQSYQAEHFLPALHTLISDSRLQRKLRQGARNLIKQEYHPKRVNSKLKVII